MNDNDQQPIPGGGRPAGRGRGREGSGLGGLWLLLVPLACCGGPLLVAALAAAGALAWGGIGLAAAVLLAGAVLAIRRRRRACWAPAELASPCAGGRSGWAADPRRGAGRDSAADSLVAPGAGEAAAGRLLDAGRRVAVVERELIGGECAYWACIPFKTLLRAPEAKAEAARAAGVATPGLDWPELRDYRDYMVRHLDDAAQVRGYEQAGALPIVRDRCSVTARRGAGVAQWWPWSRSREHPCQRAPAAAESLRQASGTASNSTRRATS